MTHDNLATAHREYEAARLLGRADLSAQVHKQTGAVLHQLRTSGPRGSVDFAAAAPGLMDGLAGLGLGLLRLSHPDQVPLFQALAAAPKL